VARASSAAICAEELAANGHDLTVVDNFVPYYGLVIKDHNVEAVRQAAHEAGGSYELIEASITDQDTVDELVADTEVIYHQAA